MEDTVPKGFEVEIVDFDNIEAGDSFPSEEAREYCARERQVRKEFSRVSKLAGAPPTMRGWTLDVLTTVRKLGKDTFWLQELYELEHYLQNLHPRNQNVRSKVRQQLQVLRDLGLIEFKSRGNYRLRN